MSRDPYCMTDRAEGNVQPSYIFAELCTCKIIFAITQDRIAQERFGIEKSTLKKIEQTKNYTNCTIYNLSIQINWQLYTYSMMLEMTQFAMYKHFSSCYGKFIN